MTSIAHLFRFPSLVIRMMFAHKINWRLVVKTHIFVSAGNLALWLILYALVFCWCALFGGRHNVEGLFSGQTVASQFIRIALSVVLVVGGGVYLSKSLSAGIRVHTIAFSTIFLATTLLTALTLFDDGFSIEYVVYYVMIIPAALFGEFLGIKVKPRKVKKLN